MPDETVMEVAVDSDAILEIQTGTPESPTTYLFSAPSGDGYRNVTRTSGDLTSSFKGKLIGAVVTVGEVTSTFPTKIEDGRYLDPREIVRVGDCLGIERMDTPHQTIATRPVISIKKKVA